MIKVNRLSFRYPNAGKTVLDAIDLSIQEGEFVAIMGENGCGKTTLCKAITGIIPEFIEGDLTGSIIVDGENVLEMDMGNLVEKVGYVYQDFENQIICANVLQEASFMCVNYALQDAVKRGREALKQCHLEDKEKNYVWQLSGGEQHLLALAGTLAMAPSVLIFDEPIGQLDMENSKRIYDVLKQLNEQYHKTILVIEHDVAMVRKYCRRIIYMNHGKVQWDGDTKTVLSKIEALQNPVQLNRGGWDALQDYVKAYFLSKKVPKSSYQEDSILLAFRDVRVQFEQFDGGRKSVIDDFNLEVYEGERIAVIGNNGAGKSTLLKLLAGQIKQWRGNIVYRGKKLQKLSRNVKNREIVYVPQNADLSFIKDSLREDLNLVLKEFYEGDVDKRREEILEKLQLKGQAGMDGRLLSGGQKKKAALAIALAGNPKLMLLDEPTTNLDARARQMVMDCLCMMKEAETTYLVATHDMEFVDEWADRLIYIQDGNICLDMKLREHR